MMKVFGFMSVFGSIAVSVMLLYAAWPMWVLTHSPIHTLKFAWAIMRESVFHPLSSSKFNIDENGKIIVVRH